MLNIKLKLIRFNLPVGGSTLFTKINIVFYAPTFTLLRIICTNCPTVKSARIIYMQIQMTIYSTTIKMNYYLYLQFDEINFFCKSNYMIKVKFLKIEHIKK